MAGRGSKSWCVWTLGGVWGPVLSGFGPWCTKTHEERPKRSFRTTYSDMDLLGLFSAMDLPSPFRDNARQYNTIQYNAWQCCTIQPNTTQCHHIEYKGIIIYTPLSRIVYAQLRTSYCLRAAQAFVPFTCNPEVRTQRHHVNGTSFWVVRKRYKTRDSMVLLGVFSAMGLPSPFRKNARQYNTIQRNALQRNGTTQYNATQCCAIHPDTTQ
eukprot:3613734-Pyramimonas_sp.AAC.1